MTYEEKRQEAISVVFKLNLAIYDLENALCRKDITKALDLIPDKVFVKIFKEYRAFYLHDMTRADFIKILKHQLHLRKRAMARYIKMGSS